MRITCKKSSGIDTRAGRTSPEIKTLETCTLMELVGFSSPHYYGLPETDELDSLINLLYITKESEKMRKKIQRLNTGWSVGSLLIFSQIPGNGIIFALKNTESDFLGTRATPTGAGGCSVMLLSSCITCLLLLCYILPPSPSAFTQLVIYRVAAIPFCLLPVPLTF